MRTDHDFMDVFVAAALLGVHVQTLRKMARQGKIPSFKLGRDWKFSKDALLRWAGEQHRVGGGCSVLVVDDDEGVCKALVRLLRDFGCRARQASTGRAGLELIAEEAPDLVLLDLQMPGMNGVQVLEELRKAHPALPVIIVTGYPDSELLQQAAQFAPVMLLGKPVERELLHRTLRTVVGEKLPSGAMAVAPTGGPHEANARNT